MDRTREFYRQVQATIEERLPTYFPEFKEYGSKLRITIQKVSEGSSGQALILNPMNKDGETIRRIFAKVPANRPLVPSEGFQFREAKREYDALQSLWGKFVQSPRFHIPRPLDLIPELNLLVVEGVSGTSLNMLLNKFGLPLVKSAGRRELEEGFGLAGEWLAFLHRITYEGDVALSIDSFVSELEGMLGQPFVPLDREKRRSILKRIAELAPKDASLPFSGCHNDYSCPNVLIANGIVTAIDFSWYRRGFIYVDLAHFLQALLIKSRIPWLNSRFIQKLGQIFLGSYAHHGFRVDANVLIFFSALRAAHSICSSSEELEGIRRGNPGRYPSILRKAYYTREIKRPNQGFT